MPVYTDEILTREARLPLTQHEFATLFSEHYLKVYKYARFQVNDDMTAEDLTAEIFERAYRHLESYDPARSAFSTWIGNIAHNWIVNYFEKQQSKKKVEVDQDLENLATNEALPESQVITQQDVERLVICLDTLSERDRQIMAMRFWLTIRNKEIAEILGIKERSVSVILLRALERLRICQEAQ